LITAKLPALSGKQLIRLLKKDGWQKGRQATHGRTMTKHIGDKTRVTFIPAKGSSLPEGTLNAILGDKQTGIGKDGLLELLKRFG
jgi:predicted RNA binding protein YcfA (HicA-like mRNA interferase family)